MINDEACLPLGALLHFPLARGHPVPGQLHVAKTASSLPSAYPGGSSLTMRLKSEGTAIEQRRCRVRASRGQVAAMAGKLQRFRHCWVVPTIFSYVFLVQCLNATVKDSMSYLFFPPQLTPYKPPTNSAYHGDGPHTRNMAHRVRVQHRLGGVFDVDQAGCVHCRRLHLSRDGG